ncbi:MAG TPA: alpha/beta hydrolase [Stellaceae bacterium]|jgi:pimeloyl-ACP methyl ester carboxylesterase|nr:alpha/beta hydrolase [Stellaceae bacterium]
MATQTIQRPDLIEVNGIAIEMRQRGAGPTLLYLHPHIGLTRAEPFLDALATRFTVYASSHPGFGRSALPRHLTSIDDLAYVYLDLIEQLDLDRIVLVGSSLGGWLAAEIATKASARLARLVLIDPLGIRVSPESDNADIVDFFATKQAELDRLAYHDPSQARLDHTAMSEEDAYIHFRNRESAALFGWSPYMNNPKLKSRLHRIRVPTLILWGESDFIATANYGQRFADLIPGAAFALVEQAGHFPHIEQPQAVADKIVAFAGA